MAIASPRRNVYYYECSSGRFRLTYFLSPDELNRLIGAGRIDRTVVEDYPDGVDLGCTDPDFDEFEQTYGYRPPYDPGALRRAFFAILSTTHNWKNFRGSGFIPAADLERQVRGVDRELLEADIARVDVEREPAEMSLRERREIKHRQTAQRMKASAFLQEMKVQGIDPKRTLAEQQFTPIAMSAGAGAEEVFIRLHQKQRERE